MLHASAALRLLALFALVVYAGPASASIASVTRHGRVPSSATGARDIVYTPYFVFSLDHGNYKVITWTHAGTYVTVTALKLQSCDARYLAAARNGRYLVGSMTNALATYSYDTVTGVVDTTPVSLDTSTLSHQDHIANYVEQGIATAGHEGGESGVYVYRVGPTTPNWITKYFISSTGVIGTGVRLGTASSGTCGITPGTNTGYLFRAIAASRDKNRISAFRWRQESGTYTSFYTTVLNETGDPTSDCMSYAHASQPLTGARGAITVGLNVTILGSWSTTYGYSHGTMVWNHYTGTYTRTTALQMRNPQIAPDDSFAYGLANNATLVYEVASPNFDSTASTAWIGGTASTPSFSDMDPTGYTAYFSGYFGESTQLLIVQRTPDGCEAGDAGTPPSCTECGAGTWSAAQATVCTNCTTGTYSETVGGTTVDVCTPCNAGTYAASTGLSACTSCSPGRYNEAPGSSSSTACLACATGKFSTSTGADDATTCVSCIGGQWAAAGATICGSCPVNTFAVTPVGAAEECTPCGAGTTAPEGSDAAEDCQPCPTGSYLNVATCVLCTAGTYNGATGATSSDSCLPCPAGRFAGEGAANCTACSVGRYREAVGGTSIASCSFCPAGTTIATTGGTSVSNCTACPEGTASALNASHLGCMDCEAGSYATGEGNEACSLCAAGTFSDDNGFAECTPCEAGRYVETTGSDAASDCIQCPQGTYSVAMGADSATTCELCPVGHYGPSAGLSSGLSCVECEEGTFAAAGASLCETCDPGESSSRGAESCAPCAPGSYLAAPDRCDPCVAGSVATSWASTICTNCTAGYAAPAVGSSSCDACTAGRYSPAAGSTSCDYCENFYTTNTTGVATGCVLCPSGRFTNSPGVVNCTGCTAGSIAHPELAACDACAAGKYEVGHVTCVMCPLGSYSPEAGATECTPTEPGWMQSEEGQDEQVPCPPGSYNNATNASVCDPCEVGRFANTSAMTSCLVCPEPLIATSAGTSSCHACALGTFYTDPTTTCSDCPAGTQGGVAGYCTGCDLGRFSAAAAQSACDRCAAGRFMNVTASEGPCLQCGTGKSSATGASACTPCAAGRFSASLTASSCSNCVAGTYTSATGAAACVGCASGTVAPLVGSTTCAACTGGTSFSATQCEDPNACVTGSWSAWGACSVSCGTGTETRTRAITSGAAGCATTTDTQACTLGACPVDCEWSEWVFEGVCRVAASHMSCERDLVREVAAPAENGGAPCEGESESVGGCSSCTQDCVWSAWSEWSDCVASTRTRTRTTTHAQLGEGAACEGEASESEACGTEGDGWTAQDTAITAGVTSAGVVVLGAVAIVWYTHTTTTVAYGSIAAAV